MSSTKDYVETDKAAGTRQAGNAAAARPVRPLPRLRQRRRRWPVVVVVVLTLVAAGGVWAWRRSAAKATAAAAPATELVSVVKGTVEKSIESSGKVVSNLDVDIKCRASGEVVKLPFDISQSVKKGELLCQLDPTDMQLAVRTTEAMVTQSTARFAQAKDDLHEAQENLVTTRRRNETALISAKVRAANLRTKADRLKQLLERKISSVEDWETAETEAAAAAAAQASAEIAIDELKQQEIQIQYKQEAVKVAEAQLQADEVTRETQKQLLAYTTVIAPITGVVAALNVQKGTIVASGMSGFSGGTTIMTLSDLSRIFIMATVDESDIGEILVGQQARVTVASFPGRTFAGQVVRIAAKGVNASNVVTFEVKVEVLDEHKDLLRPEMTGNITIIQTERTDVLTLPAAALVRQGNQVFVTMADAQRRQVKLGLEGTETVEVISGLAAGDRVVVTTAELPTRWKNQNQGPGGGPPPH